MCEEAIGKLKCHTWTYDESMMLLLFFVLNDITHHASQVDQNFDIYTVLNLVDLLKDYKLSICPVEGRQC